MAVTRVVLENAPDGVRLAYYPVVVDPPPARRARDPRGRAVGPGEAFEIDPLGFAPLFLAEGEGDSPERRGLTVELVIRRGVHAARCTVERFRVPPGREGSDPALAPERLAEHAFEPDPGGGDTLVVAVGPRLEVAFRQR